MCGQIVADRPRQACPRCRTHGEVGVYEIRDRLPECVARVTGWADTADSPPPAANEIMSALHAGELSDAAGCNRSNEVRERLIGSRRRR